MGYQGEAQVKPCSEDNEEFTLTGCEKISCGSKSLEEQPGYIITENNLNVSEFDVEVKCDETNGYLSKPTISTCTENGESYTLEGCNFKSKNVQFQIPQDISLILKIIV